MAAALNRVGHDVMMQEGDAESRTMSKKPQRDNFALLHFLIFKYFPFAQPCVKETFGVNGEER